MLYSMTTWFHNPYSHYIPSNVTDFSSVTVVVRNHLLVYRHVHTHAHTHTHTQNSVLIAILAHLFKTSLKSHFQYNKPFERETRPLRNDTKRIILSHA